MLQEKWRSAVGEHASQQDLVSKSLAYVGRHWDDFMRESSWKPLNPAQIKKLEGRLFADLGESLSDRVDEILYGSQQ